MQKRGLDGLLMFRQESMYYLTGYDTFGYVFFQCLYLGADGRMTLLTRAPDLRAGAAHLGHRGHPHLGRRAATRTRPRSCATSSTSFGLSGKTLGVEWEAYGLTARNGMRLRRRSTGSARCRTPPTWSARLRLVKSPAELAYVRARRGAGRRCAGRGAPAGRSRAPSRATSWRRCRRVDLPRRRRRSGQRVHHRLRPRRAAVPLFDRPAQARRRRTS